MQALKTAVAERIASAETALREQHADTITVGQTEFAFQEMSSRGGQRFDLIMTIEPMLLRRVDSAWRKGTL